MTLDGDALWCCCYADFPIVRVEAGNVRQWRNEVTGGHALAVDGYYVLLAGGYADKRNRVALLQLNNDRAQLLGEWEVEGISRRADRLVVGQGSTLHIVGDGRWTHLTVAAVRAALGV